ncbi:hypothetical protein BE21_22670 [Sorangium cellulosum]|uniref:Oxidoreductase n=1 Tax=Sorangium cellulosum TaxID=56 RepID=A0A150TV97_SORCE|nr:hypothetical protein BE21_22670 [Sorangium cellulosum]
MGRSFPSSKPAPKEIARDARGYELQFATSHLGRFQLTLRLLPALRAAGGARVVNVSSGAHGLGEIRWDDPNFATGYEPTVAYAQPKKANVLFAVELARRWASEKIRGYAVHPGVVVGTTLNSAVGPEALRAMGLIDEAGEPIIAGLREEDAGARRELHRGRGHEPAPRRDRRRLPERQRRRAAGRRGEAAHSGQHPVGRDVELGRSGGREAALGAERAALARVIISRV